MTSRPTGSSQAGNPTACQLMLQDIDALVEANESAALLAQAGDPIWPKEANPVSWSLCGRAWESGAGAVLGRFFRAV